MSDLKMSSAEVAATRKLIGLTLSELADELGVGISAVRDWERGRFSPREGLVRALLDLREVHDREVSRLLVAAVAGTPIHLPAGPKPKGWYLALGARVIDRFPDAILDWAEHG
ncbi:MULTISPECIES: helix-turn-helix domain-containing protein [Bacillati]|uniref:Transcriptional regulator with XRE-family HTH domain n=1 Tax=Arthrobacter russicus TaxID=172040 RepID=A0ABU1JC12_9MICC|nr:helix-turn-helix transcriptional regulator [Arthrobacter russicus]MDR6268937.1 transcriptional regulator with XRE-family HTH domain [Arthrobacter russicus]MDR6270578.1 transcriptional regulator with XRE-family HTH domain [Arthrobacter russicus]